jgi:hypothetical protein
MTVDPKVFALAESFVADLMAELYKTDLNQFHKAFRKGHSLIQRAAEAMQQAIEAEVTEIRRELEDATP